MGIETAADHDVLAGLRVDERCAAWIASLEALDVRGLAIPPLPHGAAFEEALAWLAVPDDDRATMHALLTFWGFGLIAQRAGHGALFLPRLSLRPRCGTCRAPLDGRWDPHDFDDFHRPAAPCDHRRVRLLLADLLGWLAAYERFVVQEAGLAFRAASIAAWKRPAGSAHDLPARGAEDPLLAVA